MVTYGSNNSSKKGVDHMAYSLDFRKCVIENIESGMTWEKATTTFSISRDTLRRWITLQKEKGSLKDSPRKTYKVRKIDSQALISILEKDPEATLGELAELFNCWPHAIHRRLKKLGITRKKNDPIC